MDRELLRGLVARVRKDEKGLRTVGTFLESRRVVKILLFSEGQTMSFEGIVVRVMHSPFAKELVDYLMSDEVVRRRHARLDRHLSLILGAALAREWGRLGLEEVRLHLLRERSRVVREWWLNRVRHYVDTSDYRRAWEEIEKFYRACKKDSLLYSVDDLSALIGELFVMMECAKLVTPMSSHDYLFQSVLEQVTVYELRPSRPGGRPEVRTVTHERPGWNVACFFGATPLSIRKWSRPLQDLTPAGGMALKIAAYFRNQRTEQQRRLHEEAVAAYDGARQRSRRKRL